MPQVEMSWRVDWRKFKPSRLKVFGALALWAVLALVITAQMYYLTLTGKGDIVIGGDFIAFYTAAKGVLQGSATEIYNIEFFKSLLAQLYPQKSDLNLTWQYPPTYLLIVAPLALLPHLAAYAIWSTASAAGFAAAMRNIARDRLVWFAAIVSPSAYAAFITGQNGFFTAALIILAAVYPKTRPILAGLAAGLLTVKPHLGVLLPIAYLAAGCWRAFFIAAATSVVLALTSLLAFGPDVWRAFFTSLHNTSEFLSTQKMPVEKMATPYSAALYLGLPDLFAKFVYGLFAAASAIVVALAWRRVGDPLLRASALIACVFMTAPYGYHYELIMLALPLSVVAMRALENGWLRFEKLMLLIAFVAPIFYGYASKTGPGLSYPFIGSFLAFAMTMRRIHHEEPEVFSFRKKPAA